MKKIIAGLFAIAAFTFSAAAQDQTTDGQRKGNKERHGMHKGHDGKGFEALNLTDAQKQQMKSINEEFKTRMQTLQKNDNILVKDMKEQRKALMTERKNKIAAILTPEQKTKFEQLRKDHGSRGDFKNKTKGEGWKQKRKVEDGKEKVKVKS
jgi:Spy/CpxP family protein refolding chaperone